MKKGEITKKAASYLFERYIEGKDIKEEKEKVKKIKGEELLKIVEKYNYNIKEVMKNYSLRIEGKEIKDMMRRR